MTPTGQGQWQVCGHARRTNKRETEGKGSKVGCLLNSLFPPSVCLSHSPIWFGGVAFHDWLLHLDVKETPEWDQRSNPEFPLYYSAILHWLSSCASGCRGARAEGVRRGGNLQSQLLRSPRQFRGWRRTDNLYHPHSWTRPAPRFSARKWNRKKKGDSHTVGWITWLIAPLWRFLRALQRSVGCCVCVCERTKASRVCLAAWPTDSKCHMIRGKCKMK